MIISPFKAFRWFLSIITAIVWIYTLIYLMSGMEDIKLWYSSNLHDFYQMDIWRNSIFTPDVKKSGNILSLILSILMTLTTAYLWRIRDDDNNLRLYLRVSMWQIAIGFFCLCVWLWYGHHCPYAYDEVFSAYHLAARSPWLSLSYYPLPNNHILFNLLNSFAGMITDDYLLSGRIVSLIALMITGWCTFYILSSVSKNNIINILLTVLVISQFPVLGFATQARGYSMLITYAALAITGLRTERKYGHYLWSFSIVSGMAIMPSFLYIWCGLGMAYLFLQRNERSRLIDFICQNLVTLLMVWVFYLPALTLSGWKSLFANKYVASTSTGIVDFTSNTEWFPYMDGLLKEWFGISAPVAISIVMITLMISVIFLHKDVKIRSWWMYMAGMIAGTVLIIFVTMKLPFYRNLAPLCLLIWIGITLLLAHLANQANYLKYVVFGAASLILFSTHMRNSRMLPDSLYYYDVRSTAERYQACVNKNIIDASYNITLHENAFYWYSILPKEKCHFQTSKTPWSGDIYMAPSDVKEADVRTTLLWECEGYKCYKMGGK
jgi:hypothetical protein